MARLHRRLLAGTLLAVTAALLLAPWSVQSFTGGLGDGAISFGGCTCHITGQGGTTGGGTIAMWASDLNPRVGSAVQVRVNVTMAELSGTALVGVFLLRDFTGGDLDRPVTDGWRIEVDPNGGRNNYVERTLPGIGIEVSLLWNLTAPLNPGTYRLYARTQHGGGNTYFENHATGLEFSVFTDAPLVPNLQGVRAWVSSTPREGGEAVLYGEFFGNGSADLAGFDVAFFVDGASVGVLENLTIPMQRTRTFSLTWTASAPGEHTLVVRADAGGVIGESSETDNEVSATFTVLPPLPHEVPGFDALGALGAVLAAFLVLRRRRDR